MSSQVIEVIPLVTMFDGLVGGIGVKSCMSCTGLTEHRIFLQTTNPDAWSKQAYRNDKRKVYRETKTTIAV